MENINFEPLSRKIADGEIATFRRSETYKSFKKNFSFRERVLSTIRIRDYNATVFLDKLAWWLAGAMLAYTLLLGSGGVWTNSAGAIGVVVAVTALGLMILREACKTDEKFFRLSNFASINNLQYTFMRKESNAPTNNGIFFHDGHSRTTYDIISSDSFEIGNYSYVVLNKNRGFGKHQAFHQVAYVRINLRRNVPHLILDSKRNNAHLFGLNISNLPVGLKKSQSMGLEGDFDDYFTLYAPEGYQHDALYILTPDLMALLIDEAQDYDVEMVDNYLYIYSSEHFTMTDEETLKRLFAIISLVGNKTINRTSYYADERVGKRSANVVDTSGARLKPSFFERLFGSRLNLTTKMFSVNGVRSNKKPASNRQ